MCPVGQGVVYVFTRRMSDRWEESEKIWGPITYDDDGSKSQFGSAIALDGTLAAIVSPAEFTNEPDENMETLDTEPFKPTGSTHLYTIGLGSICTRVGACVCNENLSGQRCDQSSR